ncbi:hypothetical protein ACFLUP_04865 [Chloroflexota bacterium]
MEIRTKEQVEKLLGDLVCEKGLACIKYPFEELCNAKDIGEKSFLVCLDEDSQCSFSTFPGEENPYWCQCPVRMFIKREYNR